jgi:integrase
MTYVLAIQSPGKNPQMLRIGDARALTLEQAREKALRIQGDLLQAALESGFVAQSQPKLSFSSFVEGHYLPFILAKQRSTAAAESYLRNWIIPSLGEKMLDDITKRDIVFLTRSLEIAELKPGSVNRILNIVKSCFSKAIEWELCTLSESPAKGVAEVKDSAAKERVLSQDEAHRLIHIVRQSRNPMLFPIVGFLLMTGARRSEALNARWEHIDLARKVWLIPISKSGKPRHIPLSAKALSFLAEAKLVASRSPACKESPYVFCNPKSGRAFTNIFNSWDKARERAGLKDVRMHDLRHSFASALVNNGLSIYDVKELLGHASINTTQRYAHLSQDRLAQATETVAGHYGGGTKEKPIDHSEKQKMA